MKNPLNSGFLTQNQEKRNMLSMKSQLKNTINGKDYIFICDPDSPLADAIESNAQFGSFLAGKQAQSTKGSESVPTDITTAPEQAET